LVVQKQIRGDAGMGMEQTVVFCTTPPPWTAARDLLAARAYPLNILMIDGQLAFPNEQPPETWRELRLGTPQGMVTVRRQADRLLFVTWGNADTGLLQAWNALTWAFAKVGGGEVETADGTIRADEFQRHAELPPGIAQNDGETNRES
jgi:hypothetical protein